MSAQKKWFVLINPTSGGGRGKKHWPKISQELKRSGINFDFRFTEFAKHGLELIDSAIEEGHRNFIAVGGDGTLHELVNAIMTQNAVPKELFCIGLVPVGTGNDWARHYGIPKSYKAVIDRISRGHLVEQDIGKIVLKNSVNEPIFFNNLAGIGFDGYVVEKVNRFKHWGAMAYLIGALSGLMSYKNFMAEIQWDNNSFNGKVFMLIIGLGTYSGGGMQLTENPDPSDGFFDISLLPAQSKFKILGMLPSLFNGAVTRKRSVKTGLAKALTISVSEMASAVIQADGEPVGKGNFEVSILARALRFCV
ncbi:MAG: diacylglycerol kinase family lipid kinase [Flavobacteriaceae bacterium]|nr:diacylglycerol kinase family lipid kinase [Flavobacteriaceae bacterium]